MQRYKVMVGVVALGTGLGLAACANNGGGTGDSGPAGGVSEATIAVMEVPGVGPSLVNVIGRKAGADASGVISRGTAESGIVWDEKTLDEYLASPKQKIHGTVMPVGVKDAQERANLIAYLKTLKK